MISVSGRDWQKVNVNPKIAKKIQQEFNVSQILSELIASRNFNENEIYLIENNLELSNIFKKNQDFIKSSELLEIVIKNKEKICILGDYDVDGSAATSLWIKFLKSINHPHFH